MPKLHPHSAFQLIRKLQGQPRDEAIQCHHRQAAQPLHRHAAGGVLESEALQQFALLGCLHTEPQGRCPHSGYAGSRSPALAPCDVLNHLPPGRKTNTIDSNDERNIT